MASTMRCGLGKSDGARIKQDHGEVHLLTSAKLLELFLLHEQPSNPFRQVLILDLAIIPILRLHATSLERLGYYDDSVLGKK